MNQSKGNDFYSERDFTEEMSPSLSEVANGKKSNLTFFKTKKTKLIVACVLTIAIIGTAIYFVTSNKSALKLKDHIATTVEYGQVISLKPENYLDDKKTEKEVITKTQVTTDALNEDNKGYPPVGKYKVILTYNDEKKEVNIEVKDTIPPTFNEEEMKTSLEYTRDCKPTVEDLAKQFQADDLSQMTVTVDDSQVDYSKDGEYKAVVKAVDTYENTAEKEITIKISAPTLKLDKSNQTIYVKENFIIKADIVGKDTQATFISSDKKIATVDGNGKVTGVKAGNTTITVEANGVKEECKVTVKKVPTNSNTTTQTVTNPNTGKQETVTVIESKPNNPPSNGSSNSSNVNNSNTNSNNSSSNATESKPVATITMETLNYINEERVKLGRNPLKYNSNLAEAAKIRVMELTIKLAHERPDGRIGTSVLYDIDYPNIRGDGYYVFEATETLAYGYETPHDVVHGDDYGNGWKGSKGHWDALMREEFNYGAVARYENYWVAFLCGY